MGFLLRQHFIESYRYLTLNIETKNDLSRTRHAAVVDFNEGEKSDTN